MEPSNYIYYIGSTIALLGLVGLYFFGVWSRTYVMPSAKRIPIKKQLVGAIPVGLLTMGVYAKSAFATLGGTPDAIVSDCFIMAGYAIIFGMLSRESLERLLEKTVPPTTSGAK